MRSYVTACCLAVACGSCGPEAAAPSVMAVTGLDPSTDEPLLLNDEITVIFSHPLDSSSVTRQSVRLQGGDGRPVEGTWRVDGRVLEFSPRPVLARTLDDGGYVPGEELSLVLVGYPAPSALRSTDGRWLGESTRVRYRVVERDAQGFLFYDATPSWASQLEAPPNGPGFPQARPLAPGEPLVLRCLEPIDPSSLRDEDFLVEPDDPRAEGAGVRLELLRNFDDEQVEASRESRALLALRFDRPLAPGTYRLNYVGRPGSLTDFRGNPVGRLVARNRPAFRVGSDEEQSETTLDFVDDDEYALPLVVEGSDGTACWLDDGRVTVRYPAAAGDGRAGAVALDGQALTDHDLHATRLSLATGVEQALPAQGLVVLRAQGRIELAGRLLRRTSAPQEPMFPPLGARPTVRTSLSDLLATAAEHDPTWTVVIAGGDLVLDGVLEIDTPLLLVAGGRLRGVGHVKPTGAARDQIWLLGDGGFDSSFHSQERSTPRRAPGLALDPPLQNQLREPLVYSIVSSPQPRWMQPEAFTLHEAIGGGTQGEWRVHFAPRELAPGDSVPRSQLAGSPWALPGGGACRVVVELIVRPVPPTDGAPPPPWDPPFVDRVRLVWSPR